MLSESETLGGEKQQQQKLSVSEPFSLCSPQLILSLLKLCLEKEKKA